jgi:cyclic pyranopterin phosphate synthase
MSIKMVDISGKEETCREAVAEGWVFLKPEVIELIKDKKIPKGDVLEAARLAGILAAKKTPELIVLCHPIPIESIEINFLLKEKEAVITAAVKGRARTGFEMEALTAVSVAALTIYDMCKPIDKDIVISKIRLLSKTGGKSGRYVRK